MTVATALTLPSRVIAACEQLGDAASGRKVRDVLGGGSLRDITPLVTQWKRRHGVDTREGRQHSALEAAHARNALLDRFARTLAVPGNGPAATTTPSPTHDAPAALRALWRADVAGLRNDVAQLARTVTAAVVATRAAEPVPPVVVAIEPRPGRELNTAIEHIDARLSALEASLEADASPAHTVASAVNALLVDRLGALSTVVQRLAGDAAASVKDHHHRLADGLQQHLATLAAGQEALASTVGFCAGGTVGPILATLERLDRRQAARLQRLLRAAQAPPPPPSSPPPRKKKRHVLR